MVEHATVQPHNLQPAATWSAGGEAYDKVSQGIRDKIQHCVLRLDPKPGERVLDVATGTGLASRLAAARCAEVIGADIASELIVAARELARKEGLAIDYRLADAEALPFEDGSFDAVVSTCGVMFASRPEAAAAELARVTRKGGRVAITTWPTGSTPFEMFGLIRAYMPPPEPAPPSPFEWGRPERVRELLGEAFDLRFEPGTSFYREPSAEAAWETFSRGFGPLRSLVERLDPERREQLRREFVAFHDRYRTELGITMPREYLLTVGIRR
jgi:SAM-dependent methyltransferase